MKTIYKYEITAGLNTIALPEDAEILTVQIQGETPYLWALLNTAKLKKDRYFIIFGTGHDIDMILKSTEHKPYELHKYIGTFQMPAYGLVWHLFEVK
jgi:hypothetical protein